MITGLQQMRRSAYDAAHAPQYATQLADLTREIKDWISSGTAGFPPSDVSHALIRADAVLSGRP